MSRSKIYKEPQIFNEEILELEKEQLMLCFEHFKKRYDQRYEKPSEENFTYKSYCKWITSLKGYLVSNDGKRMVRFIGNYIKENEKIMYKVVYTKNFELNIFVPLTIMAIDDHKVKLRLYKEVLKMKKKNAKT